MNPMHDTKFTINQLRAAVNKNCTCGGRGFGENECPACGVWHDLMKGLRMTEVKEGR